MFPEEANVENEGNRHRECNRTWQMVYDGRER